MDLLTRNKQAVWIELTGVLREGGQLYAVFRAGSSQRILRVVADDLLSFAAFQRRTERELGLLVRHVSECELTPAARGEAWSAAVERALARGS